MDEPKFIKFKRVSKKLQLDFQHPKAEYVIIVFTLEEKTVETNKFTFFSQSVIFHNESKENEKDSVTFNETISTTSDTQYRVLIQVEKDKFETRIGAFENIYTVKFEFPGNLKMFI